MNNSTEQYYSRVCLHMFYECIPECLYGIENVLFYTWCLLGIVNLVVNRCVDIHTSLLDLTLA